MQVLFELGPELEKAVGDLNGLGAQLRPVVSEGMLDGGQQIASIEQSEYLSGQYLKRRTGNLARSVDAWMAGDLELVIGVRDNSAVDKYKWLLGDNAENQPMTITPKKGKFLTIPLDEAKTPAGVVKGEYAGGLRSIEGGFFYKSQSGFLIFAIRKGKTKRARIRPLFLLVTQVQVYDTGAQPDAVLDNIDKISDRINDKIEGILN